MIMKTASGSPTKVLTIILSLFDDLALMIPTLIPSIRGRIRMLNIRNRGVIRVIPSGSTLNRTGLSRFERMRRSMGMIENRR
jgi:hypothetical protein